MRLWSIHPKYLDRQGLIALWREALLAQSCLLKGKNIKCEHCNGTGVSGPGVKFGIECDKCKGIGKIKTPYYNHPQLQRFKIDDIGVIGSYLGVVGFEARNRGYNFNTDKIYKNVTSKKLTVTRGQLIYEFNHLQDKLYTRDKVKCNNNFADIRLTESNIEVHPLFTVVDGEVEKWEKIK
jgi:phage FluMu protein Com